MRHWIISDLHLGHRNIVSLCGRPYNFEERIFKHWKRLVAPKDIVYCLGDIALCGNPELRQWHIEIAAMPGMKILIQGNHDKQSYNWYLDHGWDLVCQELVLNLYGKRILLSHAPRFKSEVQPPCWDINVHGHMHNTVFGKEALAKYEDGYRRLFCLEWENYEPVLLQRIVDRGGK